MKKFASAFFGLSLWHPGAALMRQLRFPAKMLLVSLGFLMPMAWLLSVYLHTKSQDLDFVAVERQGVRYAAAVYPALNAAGVWRYQARNVAFGEPAAQADEARRQFEAAFKAVEAVDADLGKSLGTSSQISAVRTALTAVQAPQTSPEAVFQTMTALSRSLVALLDGVTASSGLALDPELPSYYLTSAVLLRAPQIIISTAEIRGLGGGALKAGKLSPEAAAQIQDRLAIIQHELHLAKADLDKMQAAAPDFGKQITTSAPAATQEFFGMVTSTFPPGTTEPKGDRNTFVNAANQTLDNQFGQVAKNLGVLDAMLADRQNQLQRGLILTLCATLAGLLAAGYLFMGFYRAMADGFKELRTHLIAISMGDLRAKIVNDGRDEVAGLLKELKNMQASLSETVTHVQEASDTVVQSSIEIAKGTRDLSARTEAAAAALEESSAALEQTTSTVQMTAESVRKASDIAVDNAATASRGGQVMQDVVHTMERIQGSSQKISDIIGVIDGIAFQTNILALNAAVEAARAGEQGRGFAVVATEVRALAGRSAEAAKEIKRLISTSTQEVSSGTAIVREAGAAMTEIVSNADRIKALLDEVANGAREQSLGIAQIGAGVQELDRNTQANASLVDETAAAANTQRSAAVRMAAQVDEFRVLGRPASAKVEGIDVDAIIDGHRQWKVKLRDAIENEAVVDVKTLSRDDCCPLGKWIYADGQRLNGRASFMALIDKHAVFHRVAGQVGELINQHQYQQAEDALTQGTPFANATSDVVLVLSAAKRLGFV